MCGHVSLLCLCLLFVSSSVQGGQENLPSTWTKIVREDAQARLDEGKEGTEKTFRMYEQLASCNSRTLVLQTKIDEGRETAEEALRINAEKLVTCNIRAIACQSRLEERKEGAEETRRVLAEQLANLHSRLDEAQQKLITTSLEHQRITETLRAENFRIKQQLEETTSNFGVKIEGLQEQLAVTMGDLKNKTLELQNMQQKNNRYELELITVTEKNTDLNNNVKELNEKINNATTDLHQNMFEELFNATNLQSIYVEKINKEIKQDILELKINMSKTVLKSIATVLQEIINGKADIGNKTENILLQEITSSKALRNEIKQLTANIEDLNRKMLNETKDFHQDMFNQILNAANLQSNNVKEKTLEVKEGFSELSAYIKNSMLQCASDSKSTVNAIKQEISSSKLDINKISNEITSTKTKVEAGFVKMTQERESKNSGLQSKQRDILQVLEAIKMTQNFAVLEKTVTLGGRKYFFSKQYWLNWHDAKKFCISYGLNLASIESAEENKLILDHKNSLGMGWTWVGGTDEAQEGTWRWIGTGQLFTYNNWGSGLPNEGTGQNCLDFHGTWDDYPCSTLRAFVCEL